ncbi:MAG: dethiobiotin synthase [Steroidobacteraceae bacterium]
MNKELHPLLRQSLFVTGTDTGVGKTWVCVQLLQSMVAAGYRAAGMKPVGAGVINTPDGLRNEDALALQAASNVTLPYHLVNPICLPHATSPHLAAEDAGIGVEIGGILQAYDLIKSRTDWIVVEGAGGWLAPIGAPDMPGIPGPTMQDIAVALRLPVILVVGIRLGALSHALLTAEAIRRSGLTLAGWAANCLDPGFADAGRYVESLALRLPEPMLWRS